MKQIQCHVLGKVSCSHLFEVDSFEQLLVEFKDHMLFDNAHEIERESFVTATEAEKQAWMQRVRTVWQQTSDT